MTDKSDTQDKRVRYFVNQHKADKAYWAHYCLELFGDAPKSKKLETTCSAKESRLTQSQPVAIGQAKEVSCGTR